MIKSIYQFGAGAALVLLLAGCATAPQEIQETPKAVQSTRDEVRTQAAEVYVYAYPLVLMDKTREIMTAKGPTNAFTHRRTLPDAGSTDMASPNPDTLYSTAWLDLSKGPVVLSVPDTRGRYYLMQLVDGWTNVVTSIGKRTTGTRRADYAIVGPDWRGTLPDGMQEIRSPTTMAWLIGRTHANGRLDYPAVHRLQDQYRLTPLAAWPKSTRTPGTIAPATQTPVDTETAPVEQVAAMDAQAFFTRFAALLPANPPAPRDEAMRRKLQAFGIVAGAPYATTALEPETARAIQEGATQALAGIVKAARDIGTAPSGAWQSREHVGRFGDDYLSRAATAWDTLGANLPQDAMYLRTRVDAQGEPLDGAGRYVVRFAKGELPPAKASWSLTVYGDKPVPVSNRAGRQTIGDRDRLRRNPDGSVDILIQASRPPGRLATNWLPVPDGPFNLMLRAYWPESAMFEGRWVAPPVRRVD
ncbi:DUF1254 domain-containing protein [Cupriavidus respiraculi]|uniref:DUF1254 domain-containing protein n=1 Tax=Cupriavidus respiraculi TaxID=195930 RepID=A0ABM8WJG1_9BURK|nr:DUF1254 domain-containing protein [Cupriavidus respiraculi]CAG9167530.1 hypothetical protein LMG21510_00772 [Cupriavidus respiraculi]